MTCPNCEYHKARAARWRDEAYRQAGHELRPATRAEKIVKPAVYEVPVEQQPADEPDYKVLWQQMCERCDDLDKKLTKFEAKDKRPSEADYTSQVAYTRALEAYCDSIVSAEREKFCAVLRQLHDSYSLASDSNDIQARRRTHEARAV